MRNLGVRLAMAVGIGAGLLIAAPAVAGTRIERHLALEPGGRLIVESDIGDVAVRGDAASGAAVLLTSDRDDLEKDYEMAFEARPGEAQITIKRRHSGAWLSWSGWNHRQEATAIRVSVPRTTAARVRLRGGDIDVSGLAGAAELRSSGGSIAIHDLTGKVDARSSGGNLEARNIHGDAHLESSGGNVGAIAVAGGVDAASSGGNLHLEQVAGDVRGRSSGGDVTVQAAGGRVIASSSGGEVRVSFAAGNARGGEISSSGGGVKVRVDPAVGLTLDAYSSGGSVECSLPVTVQGKLSAHHLKGVLKGGGERLMLRSSGGGVHLDRL
jgi:DUF4097 and DUF4098 domain-containing protein YvlB